MSTRSSCGSATSKSSRRHRGDGRTSSKRSWGRSIAGRNARIYRSTAVTSARVPLWNGHELELEEATVVLAWVHAIVDTAVRDVHPASAAVGAGRERDPRGCLDPHTGDIDPLDEASAQIGLQDEVLPAAHDEQALPS